MKEHFFKKNKLALPKTIFGSNNIILQLINFAPIQIGKDIYPPVEITVLILFFLKNTTDLTIEMKKINNLHGSKKIFLVNGSTSIIVEFSILLFINFDPLRSLDKKTSKLSFKCS